MQAQAGQPPANYGYLQACWTVALLVCQLRERFPIQLSAATLGQAPGRVGFRRTRAKLVLTRGRDAQADEKRARLAQALADLPAMVPGGDECEMHLLAVLRAMWQRIRPAVARLSGPARTTSVACSALSTSVAASGSTN